MNTGATLFFLTLAVAVYFIPNWIASARKHPNANAIFVTNLLLGWTLVGWVVALIWSLTAFEKKEAEQPMPVAAVVDDTKACPYCAETIKRAAVVCRCCGRELAA